MHAERAQLLRRRAQAPQQEAPRALHEAQRRLGNERLSSLLSQGPEGAQDLYLTQILAIEHSLETDLSSYLPWNASLEWMGFVDRWYSLIWDQHSATAAPVSDVGPSVDSAEVARDALGPARLQTPAEIDLWVRTLRGRSGAGRPLTLAERAFLSEVHGRELPSITLHEGGVAAAAAREINARAFTIEDEIWLGQPVDLRDPQSAALLAHETTHALQSAVGRDKSGPQGLSNPGQPLEVEAEARAREAMRVWQTRGEDWAFTPPESLDSRGRLLAEAMRAQLPEHGAAPEGRVEETLRRLLLSEARERVLDLRWRVELDEALSDQDRAQLLDELTDMDHALRDDLGLLLRLCGPDQSTLERLSEVLPPYSGLLEQARSLLFAHAGPDPEPLLLKGIHSDGAAQGPRLQSLVRTLAQALDLPAGGVNLRMDEQATQRLRALGTRGLAENGEILLDPSRFDPSSADGRGLLAHEMTHLAQERLAPLDAPQAGLFAEAEATLAARSFARGGDLPELHAGIPQGHVAADGEMCGGDLEALLAQYSAMCEDNSSSITPAGPSPANNVDPGATQDHEAKVEQYEDGVDGIADLIGDLDAFDDLCEAIDDEEDTSGPLSQVKASDDYNQLCRMWQGAKEGEEDSSQMMSIFNNEFDGRGFWGETEQAYDLVCAGAKADARPEPEAAQARTDVNEAEQNAENAGEEVEAIEEEGNEQGTAPGQEGIQTVDPATAALMASPVEETAPTIDIFKTMNDLGDDPLREIMNQLNHQQHFSESSVDISDGRGSQITETLLENFGGSFVSSFVDQGIDSMVWDNIGWGADQLIKLGTKGRLNTPMIGPLIGLAQNPPWTAEAWGGKQFGDMTQNWGRVGDTWAQFQNAQGWDAVGAFCALLADLFGGLRDLIAGIAQICGTLSALCYVVGGILILVGIALVWFFGVGAPLITAGGWLTRVGNILGRVNTILGAVVFALSALTTVFRTAAAFLVPSDMYAEQLKLLGVDASTFGEKAGERSADKLANNINDRVRGPIEDRVNGRINQQPATDGDAGRADAEEVRRRNEEDAARLQADAEEAARRAREADPDQDPNRPRDGEEDPNRRRDGDETPNQARPGRIRRFLDRVPGVRTVLRDMQQVGRDIADVVRNPGRAGREQTPSALWDTVNERVVRKAGELQREIDGVQNELNTLRQNSNADPAEIARLNSELTSLRDDAQDVVRSLNEARQGVTDAQTRERAIAQEREDQEANEENGTDNPTRRQAELAETRRRVEELEGTNRRTNDELTSARTRLEQAQGDERRAREQAETDAAALRTHTDSDDYRQRQQAHVDEHTRRQEQRVTDMDNLNTRAADLERRASDAERANQQRESSRQAQADADTARAQSESTLSQMRSAEGSRIKLDFDDGPHGNGLTNRRVISIDADGVTVTDGPGGTTRFPLSAIRGPKDLRRLANRFEQQRQEADRLSQKAETDRSAADSLAPEGTDPATLRGEAASARQQAEQQLAAHEADRNPGEVPDAQRDALRTQATQSGSAVGTASSRIREIQAEITTLETTQGTTSTQLQDARNRLAQQEAMDRRMPGLIADDDSMRASSGNATGGVGSAYKGLAESLLNGSRLVQALMGGISEATRTSEYVRSRPADKQSLGFAAEVNLEDALGVRREVGDELLAKGREQARVEQERAAIVQALLDHTPPVSDIDAMNRHRTQAREAQEAYVVAHARALRAFKAEQVVEQLSAQTQALAQQGEPLQDAAQSMTQPLQQSSQDEASRNTTLQGATANQMQQPESGLTGIVTELIAKLATHSDRMDTQPTGPDPDAGQQMQDGPQTAQDEATSRGTQSQGASEQQRQFLDQAIALRAAQEESVCGNIETLNNKYDEEQAILTEIRTQKADALAERNTQRTTTEQNAQAYMDDYRALETWRQEYVRRRAAVESLP